MREERWNREIKLFQDYAEKHGFTLLVQSAENSVSNQLKQCENLINRNIDVLIIQPLDSDSVGTAIDQAHEEGIPVISYERFCTNSDLDYYVAFDSFQVGDVQATMVTEAAPKGNYIWLRGGPEDNNAHIYCEGQESVLRPFIDRGDIKIIIDQWCRAWDPNEALKHTENGLNLAKNDIQGVIASNDGLAGGAIQALTAQGLAGKVPVSGQDGDLAACQRIVEGTQTGTAYKPIAKLNLAASEMAVALAMGKDPMATMDTNLGTWTKLNNKFKDVDYFKVEVVPINKTNLYEIMIKQDKFHTVADVYRNLPRSEWPQE